MTRKKKIWLIILLSVLTPIVLFALYVLVLTSRFYNEHLCRGRIKQLIVVDCENDKKYKYAEVDHPECTPLTVRQFYELMAEDTTKEKIVVIYSVGCGACERELPETYKPMYDNLDTSKYEMYFISHGYGALRYVKSELNCFGIYPDKYYYIKDKKQKLDNAFVPCMWWFGKDGKRIMEKCEKGSVVLTK